MKTLLGNERITSIVEFFDAPDALDKQLRSVKRIRYSEDVGPMIGGGILSFVLGLGAVYSFSQPSHEFFNVKILDTLLLLMFGASLFGLIVGPILFFMGLNELKKARRLSMTSFIGDLNELCQLFYTIAFCRKSSASGKKDDIREVMHFVPIPVLESYTKSGWIAFVGQPKAPSKSAQPMECEVCGKRVEHSIEGQLLGEIPEYANQITDELSSKDQETYETSDFRNRFLKCQNCGYVVCGECIAYSIPKHQVYLCPDCGRATNGWKGLARRWCWVRRPIEANEFAIHVDTVPRSDQRVSDITVHIVGIPSGEKVTFSNVALCIDGKWFLATPEPILA